MRSNQKPLSGGGGKGPAKPGKAVGKRRGGPRPELKNRAVGGDVSGEITHIQRTKRVGTAKTDSGEHVFFTANAVEGDFKDISAGVRVQMTVKRVPLGLKAIKIERLPEA